MSLICFNSYLIENSKLTYFYVSICVLYNVLAKPVTNQAINTLRAGSLLHVENQFIKNLVRLGKPLHVIINRF